MSPSADEARRWSCNLDASLSFDRNIHLADEVEASQATRGRTWTGERHEIALTLPFPYSDIVCPSSSRAIYSTFRSMSRLSSRGA